MGLLITEKDKFDKMIADYLDKFDAAQKLKDAVDQLFNLIDTRNEAICTYTSHFNTVAGLQAERDQKKAQVGQVAAMMKQQPGRPRAASLHRLYAECLQQPKSCAGAQTVRRKPGF